MQSIRELETVFPLSTGAEQRPVLRAPRLLPTHAEISVGFALGHSAYMRAWSGRRARLSLSPLTRVK